jgi:transposase-like protein
VEQLPSRDDPLFRFVVLDCNVCVDAVCFVEGAQAHRRSHQSDLSGRQRQAAERELQAFDEGTWGRKYPAIVESWRRNWEAAIPFFVFPAAVRKIINTTNAVESLNASVRKAVRNKGTSPPVRSPPN